MASRSGHDKWLAAFRAKFSSLEASLRLKTGDKLFELLAIIKLAEVGPLLPFPPVVLLLSDELSPLSVDSQIDSECRCSMCISLLPVTLRYRGDAEVKDANSD